MSNFKHWHDEIADIPMQDKNGVWFDAETGFLYADYASPKQASARKTVSKKALDARNSAKKIGFKALKGSAKQKEWAEKIRAFRLERCGDESKKIFNKLVACGHAKFWIETRDIPLDKFEILATLMQSLITKANALMTLAESEVKSDSSRIITSWGNYHLIMKDHKAVIEQLEKLKSGCIKTLDQLIKNDT